MEAPYYELNVGADSPSRRSNRGNDNLSSHRGRNLEINMAHNNVPLRINSPSILSRNHNA